ncbi:MAG: hypothetical protein ACOC80_15110 [Petrotogales bacterium]
MAKAIVDKNIVLEVAKEVFWIAWQNSNCLGLGLLRNSPSSSKEDVWNNITNAGDYPCNMNCNIVKNNFDIYGDYVFGRMMKLSVYFNIDTGEIVVGNDNIPPRQDYQSWCSQYETYDDLLQEAIKNVSGKYN